MITKLVISYAFGFISAIIYYELFNVKKNDDNDINSYKFPQTNYKNYIENLKKKINSMTNDEIKHHLNEFNSDTTKNLSHEEMDKNIRFEIMLLNEKSRRKKYKLTD